MPETTALSTAVNKWMWNTDKVGGLDMTLLYMYKNINNERIQNTIVILD